MATESDNVNSGALGTLLAVGTIAFFGIALVVTALVRAETVEEVEKKEVLADRPFRDLVAEQTAQLNAPAAYKDRNRGLVSLPLERAMELTVSGLAKDPNSATPPPPPSGGAAGMAATEAGGMGGSGGTGGSAQATEEPAPSEPAPGAPAPEGEKPKEKAKPEPKKGASTPVTPPASKPAPKAPAAPAPAPAPAAPAPAPTPAPNGQ